MHDTYCLTVLCMSYNNIQFFLHIFENLIKLYRIKLAVERARSAGREKSAVSWLSLSAAYDSSGGEFGVKTWVMVKKYVYL